MHSIYLVPVGHTRYELYTEPSDDAVRDAEQEHGFVRERIQRLRERWRDAVQTARRGNAVGRVARMRDWAVCRAAESIAEQRTLWSLRHISEAQLSYPSDVSEPDATDIRSRLLTAARRHHGLWLALDGVLFVVSGLLVLVPGPNVLAYYFGLRLLGHYLSWRGARHALDKTAWQVHAEPALAELRQLADLPRESRAPRVEAIANGLKLPRLAAFFDRVAV